MVISLVSLIMVTSLGCTTKTVPTGIHDEEDIKELNLVIGTAGVTGAWYPVGGSIAKIITDYLPGVRATVESTAASIQNARMINDGQLDLGLCGGNAGYGLYNGHEPYEKEPTKKIRAMFSMMPDFFQFVVRKDSKIRTIEELRGKRVVVGQPGSGTLLVGEYLLNAYDMTFEDIKPQYVGFADGFTALRDNQVDGVFISGAAPIAMVLEVASTVDIDLLPISPDIVETDIFREKAPFAIPAVLEAGIYRGVDHEVPTLGMCCMMICSEDMDEELVYQIVKSTFEHLDIVHESHAVAKEITLENALNGISIPLHPGAERFYKEQGML